MDLNNRIKFNFLKQNSLLILSVTACVGGYAYNVKVQNKHGLPAVPGYDFCIGLGKKV